MKSQTIQSVREELEKEIKTIILEVKRNAISEEDGLIPLGNYQNRLEGFNLGVSLARKEFLDKIDNLNDIILKEYWNPEQLLSVQYVFVELKKSFSEDK